MKQLQKFMCAKFWTNILIGYIFSRLKSEMVVNVIYDVSIKHGKVITVASAVVCFVSYTFLGAAAGQKIIGAVLLKI